MKVFLLVKLVFKRQEKSGKTLKNFLKQLLFFCSVVIWTKKTFFVLFCPSAITVKKKQSKSKQLCEITCFCFHVLKSPIFSLKKKKQPTLLVCKTFVLVNDGKKTPSFCLNQFFCGFFFTKSVSFGVWLLMQLFYQVSFVASKDRKLQKVVLALDVTQRRVKSFRNFCRFFFFFFGSLFFC